MAKVEGVDYVQCRHCGAQISKITVPHLRRCGAGITVSQYKLKFPGVPVEATVKKRTEAQRQAQSEKLKARFQSAEGQETKRQISEASKRMQAGEYGQRAADHLRQLNQDPEHLKEQSRRSKQMWATGRIREMQAAWRAENPDKVQAGIRHARAQISCWQNPAHREKMSRITKERWKHGKLRAQAGVGLRERWDQPEEHEKMSARAKQQWQDPLHQELMRNFHKNRWADPAYQQLMGDHMRRRWRGAFRQVMADVRARIVMPFKDSGIEVSFQRLLDRMDIAYTKHGCIPGCGSHQYDVVLDQYRVLVEVQGCWWHACPVCDRVKDPRRAELRRSRDVKKRALAGAAGWRLLEVWEHEFRDLAAVEAKVREFLTRAE